MTSERRRYRVRGVVQGVGFRPFVYGLASRHALAGYVLNDGEGVVIEAEGPSPALDAFTRALRAEAPRLARVDAVLASVVPSRGDRAFVIELSAAAARASAEIPADVATCDDCLRELFDPADRRYRYPFVNCTQCGPRFTIVTGAPYDRPLTTMAGFALCADCRREYEDPRDRRFHAEPIACPACGPRLSLAACDGGEAAVARPEDRRAGTARPGSLEPAVELLAAGKIVAVKGLGGWHLACAADDEAAVVRLRARKQREEKPLAVMTAEPELLVDATPEELALLASPARPIVLARRRTDGPVAAAVAPGSAWLGVMLPYTPLHHLLLHDLGRPIVLTSGNVTDEPIAVDDRDALERLGGIADAFLGHDRPIHRRCEDSVVRAAFPVRRSRGYVPGGLPLPFAAPRPIVAAGAELKATFCVARGDQAFLSSHLGDLDSAEAYLAFRDDLALYLEMLDVEPEVIAHDLHPEYLSTKWALEQDAELVGVQHHHAHAAACLAEHGHEGAALALVFDGTGYGDDGTLWGSELLRCDLESYERLAWLDPVPLPGGEAAVREPWRVAAFHLERAGLEVPWPEWEVVRESLKAHPPLSSGMGRLFDAVAALLGVRERISYEGQAAIELEQLAGDLPGDPWPWRLGCPTDLVTICHGALARGCTPAEVAAAFHETVAHAAAVECAEWADAELDSVVLSGGTFQNLRLLESTRTRLERLGFRVLTHRLVPPNDGGISYGQAVVAAARAR